MQVLISGAGIAGPALAFWLARRGVRATVVERAERLRAGGHAIDVRGAAVDVVERMGLYARMAAQQTQTQVLSIVRAGKPSIDLKIPRHEPGNRDIELVRDDLVRILYEATKSDAEYVFGDSIARIEDDGSGARVTFASGTLRDFDIVVGADGQHSATRRLAFGDEAAFAHPIGAYLSIFGLPNLLGIRDAALLYNEPGRAVAYYTMAGNERAKALFLFRSPSLALDLRDESALQQLLRERFSDAGWESRRFLDALSTSSDFYFDEIAQIRMERWSRGRVVLLGDAAHGPSPLSGQGTSLALVGAFVLADALRAHSDIAAASMAYELRMRRFVAVNQAIANDGLKMLLPGSRLTIGLRNLAMRAVPLLQRMGAGMGSKIQRASRAIELPSGRFSEA